MSDPAGRPAPIGDAAAPAEGAEAPRLAPLTAAEQDDEVRELLAPALGSGMAASNIFTTLVRHRGLYRKWHPFAGKLLHGKIPARQRELVILRTGWRCGSEYEWGQHKLLGLDVGLTAAEIERVKAGPSAPGWEQLDAALLRAVDELHDGNRIGDQTWSELAEHLDEKQLIELLLLVGNYTLVAYSLNTLRVQREPGVPGFEP